MPTYDYRCAECGHRFELVQSFSDPAVTDCPSCAVQGSVRKVYGNVGVVLKGSGFYRNDSRGRSSSVDAKGSEKSGSEGGSGSGGAGSDGAKASDSKGSGSEGSGSKGSGSKGSDSKGSGSKGSGAPGSGSGSKAAAAS